MRTPCLVLFDYEPKEEKDGNEKRDEVHRSVHGRGSEGCDNLQKQVNHRNDEGCLLIPEASEKETK